MSAATATTYRVEAYNLSHASENKIHDDAVAQKLGFAGGLVPGVEVYAYACHPAVERWGRAWLERGHMECRFLKPVYDGRIALVSAAESSTGLDLEVHSEGVLCATGRAWLSDGSAGPPSIGEFQQRTPPPPAERPPASQSSLAEGTWLGIAPMRMTPESAAGYLRDVRETDAIYAREGLIHPGALLRLCNLALRENVVLPPWIHTGSKVANFAAGRVGDELSVRARVAANYEKKGHRLVDLDALVIANGRTVVARVLHTAVYQLRQLA
jgi:acyl dehydratase